MVTSIESPMMIRSPTLRRKTNIVTLPGWPLRRVRGPTIGRRAQRSRLDLQLIDEHRPFTERV